MNTLKIAQYFKFIEIKTGRIASFKALTYTPVCKRVFNYIKIIRLLQNKPRQIKQFRQCNVLKHSDVKIN